jgi:peroxiredoxin
MDSEFRIQLNPAFQNLLKKNKTIMFKKAKYIIICLVLSATSTFAQTVKVTGDISGLTDPQLLFYYYVGDSTKTDTVEVKGGNFTWVAKMPESQKVMVMFPNRYVEFFAESGTIKITGSADSLDKLKITGSKSQDELDAYNNSLQDITAQESPLYEKWGKGSKEEQAALEAKLDNLRMQKRARANQYVVAHPNSPVSLSLVSERAMMGDYSDVKPIYEKLDKSLQETPEGKRIAERLVVLKRSDLGEPMLDFTQNNMDGQPVKFADFKGKYVLVDFWASWCGPCRAENPNVLKAYNEYKGKNFTVVGISLDDKGDKWEKAVKDDHMPWTELSDLKGWKNEVAAYYGIQAIPCTYLVNPQGKIIATYLRGEALHKKLAELLN